VESATITIHLARIGKPERVYREGFLADDGIRMKTHTVVSEPVSLHLSEKFKQAGWLRAGQRIHSISKHHFYQEWFSILEYRGAQGEALGYYCDIVTPLRKVGGEYFLTDLILDLWIWPDFNFEELDWDEFEAAITGGLLSAEWREASAAAIKRLINDVRRGAFKGFLLA
jgi:predicted RNA-binding protein associated with RNAse of E/G family